MTEYQGRTSPETHRKFKNRWRKKTLASALIFSAAVWSYAEFISLPEDAPEKPGVPLEKGTDGLGGTVIAADDTYFRLESGTEGFLRSFVVDTGEGYDYYFQVQNTGGDGDIFGIQLVRGFEKSKALVTYTNDLSNLKFGEFEGGPEKGLGRYEAGDKPFFSAFRNPKIPGGFGFDFSEEHAPFNEANLFAKQSSAFVVIRTDEARFFSVTMQIRGIDDTLVESFAPVPEPQTLGLLAAGGALLLPRQRRKSRVRNSAS